MNTLITIVMDKTNYRGMAQLSHIVAQLFLCGRVGPWPMFHDHDPTLQNKRMAFDDIIFIP